MSKLKPEECENLIRLATLARKASFKYEADSYVLSDISKIPGFLKVGLDKWREFFKIRKDANVDMLSYGERKVELRPVARPVRGDSADFDVKWTPCIDGEEIDESEMSKLVGGVGSLRIIPEFGIVRVSASDTALYGRLSAVGILVLRRAKFRVICCWRFRTAGQEWGLPVS